jgi:hypothetical protein
LSTAANAQRVLSPQEAAQAVQIRDLQATAAEVTGTVVNNTPHIIRQIEILTEYHWLWANEFKPGPESPGRVASVKLDTELRPRESLPFRYAPEPSLPNRQDGRFVPEVTVAGFTTVVPATETSR